VDPKLAPVKVRTSAAVARVPRGRAARGACTGAAAGRLTARAGQVWVSDELRAGGAGDADAVAAGPSFGDSEVICIDPEAKVARQSALVPRGTGSAARPSPRFPR
jgi:hypothetical protein